LGMTLEGVGAFRSGAGAVTLRAGVRAVPALLSLHQTVGSALAHEGVRPEARPYSPHVTLGRIESGAMDAYVGEFRARNRSFLSEGHLAAFSLFVSRDVDGVPAYSRLETFSLA
ncbi:MAG TPA: 2'-5' RNA ligase family protein, partial [Planctomycetota bacterium]|nr:2'-5' RNA ligase family protein [Planctomycetota bacterium]